MQSQIQKICGEIAGNLNLSDNSPAVDESDLSLKKLDEYQSELQELQKEKVNVLCCRIMYQLITNLKTQFDFIQ